MSIIAVSPQIHQYFSDLPEHVSELNDRLLISGAPTKDWSTSTSLVDLCSSRNLRRCMMRCTAVCYSNPVNSASR